MLFMFKSPAIKMLSYFVVARLKTFESLLKKFLYYYYKEVDKHKS